MATVKERLIITEKEYLLELLKTAFRTITPWKQRNWEDSSGYREQYVKGWNDCLKEIKKNRKKYLEFVSTLKQQKD